LKSTGLRKSRDQNHGGDKMKNVAMEESIMPPKPIAGRLNAEALRQCLEIVDKKELSKALAGRNMKSFIQGAIQLFSASVVDPHYDKDNFIHEFQNIKFYGTVEYTYTLRWCVDNNAVFLIPHPEGCPATILLRFFIPSKTYYLFAIHAARINQGKYKAEYSFDIKDPEGRILEGTLNMDNRDNLQFDPPVPLLVYLDPTKYGSHHRLWFSGNQISFRSISLWKF
jgi:hypothetical protein